VGDTGEWLNQRALGKALGLGLALALTFLVVGGGLWALGDALGLGTILAFFLAACIAPVVVVGPLLLWLFGLSPERRRALLAGGAGRGDDSGETPDR
jgi:hypothetical protein